MSRLFCFFFFTLLGMSAFSQWNPNTSVNLEVSGLDASDLQSVSTSDGKTWIAFYSLNASGNYDMRAQLLDINGNKLFGPDGMIVSALPSGSATFVFNVCTDIFDNLIIGYQTELAGALTALVTKVQTDGSLPWSTGITLGAGLAPYPAVTKTNEVIVAWNNNSPATSCLQKISSSGTLAWTTPVPITVGTSNTTRTQVVCNSNGDFTAVFQRKSFGISTTLYAQRYTTDGVAIWPTPIQLSNQTTSAARYYSVLAEGNTTYVGYYTASGSRFFGYIQKISADGTLPWGINGSAVSTYASGTDPMPQTTQIARESQSPYIWSVSTYSSYNQTAYGVYVQKMDTATGTRQLVATGKEVFPVSAAFDTQAGRLSLINDGPLFISYDANYKIYATRLNDVGDFVWTGNRIELSSTTATAGSPKGRFAFTQVVSNHAVAVWSEDRGGGNRAYAQSINSSGVLPVAILDFSGKQETKGIRLFWQVDDPTSLRHFIVEKSKNGSVFERLVSITPTPLSGLYNYLDNSPYSSRTFYRLTTLGLDHSVSVSKTIAFTNSRLSKSLTLFPQPANDQLNVDVAGMEAGSYSLAVLDGQGRKIKSSTVFITAGMSVLRHAIVDLPAGFYFIQLGGLDSVLHGSFIKN